MPYAVVLNNLVTLPTSIYFGDRELDISHELTESDARRYLGELILINDWQKADLTVISDNGSFEDSSSTPMQEIQQSQEEAKEILTILRSSKLKRGNIPFLQNEIRELVIRSNRSDNYETKSEK